MGYDFQIMTEKGVLEYCKQEGPVIRFYDGIEKHVPGKSEITSSKIIWEQDDTVATSKYTYFEIDHFADCVINGKQPITDGESALKGLQLIWALYDGEKTNIAPDLTKFDLGDENRALYDAYIAEMNEKNL